jgi:hypothetical protein
MLSPRSDLVEVVHSASSVPVKTSERTLARTAPGLLSENQPAPASVRAITPVVTSWTEEFMTAEMLSYSQLGDRLNCSPEAARALVKRLRLPP